MGSCAGSRILTAILSMKMKELALNLTIAVQTTSSHFNCFNYFNYFNFFN
jgi:hypothetical protein